MNLFHCIHVYQCLCFCVSQEAHAQSGLLQASHLPLHHVCHLVTPWPTTQVSLSLFPIPVSTEFLPLLSFWLSPSSCLSLLSKPLQHYECFLLVSLADFGSSLTFPNSLHLLGPGVVKSHGQEKLLVLLMARACSGSVDKLRQVLGCLCKSLHSSVVIKRHLAYLLW